ncbi:hypothetical protein LTR62_004118 [Meristemomyces frigidus]|uniref:RRM domain-containing protein n=1 Tax=Meristemomyces frigidus TaxID=1508187 RepID=A0AAN7YU40_9PEZI|nr:hypothetical protein LTR62_004118 [Meristemomyces frigidus]
MVNRKNRNNGQTQSGVAVSLDEALQASRKERGEKLAQEMLGTNPQKLAQEMLGSRRTSTPTRPVGPGPLAGTLASRVGITKRSSSLPRTNSATSRQPRQPSHLSRPPIHDNSRPQPSRSQTQPRIEKQARAEPQFRQTTATTFSSDPPSKVKSNGHTQRDIIDNGNGLSIRGAAGGPYIVRAHNFAPGTTAADIESVMQNVGGQMNYCKLVSAPLAPGVVAEMSFVDRSGADDVIRTFDGKKADGRVLYVTMESETGVTGHAEVDVRAQDMPVEDPLLAFVDTTGDTAMEIDEHADARAAEERQREDRRREPRGPPTGPSQRPVNDYPRRAEPAYQDGRYGYDGRDRGYRGGGGGGRGGYRDDGRMYSDRMRHERGGQSYRP